jgi:DeoR/GlpR family transcriptional regulator of sugar metabolism
VVTTGLTTTNVLEQSTGVDLIVVGGRLRHISSGFVGPFAERVMADISADVAFLGADGVSAEHGLCEETPEQASLKRVMVERARELHVLADSTKLGVASAHWWTRIERPWVLVTDDGATEEQLEPFRASDLVTVHVAATDPSLTGRRTPTGEPVAGSTRPSPTSTTP